jgi:sensor histidine kinase regulating citrate/malate metabolism/HPt (histidine-containing phosphotransfer) domain-containing protein
MSATPTERRPRFLARLVVGFLTPLVVAAVCQITYTVLTQRRMTDQALSDKASSLAAAMVNVAGPSIAFDDVKAVADALASVQLDPDFAFSTAVNAHGDLLASRGTALGRGRGTGGGPAAVVTAPEVVQTDGVMTASYPVRSGGQIIGAVSVGLRTARIAALARRLSIVAELISLLGVAAAVLVVLALTRRISRCNRDMAMLLDTVEQGFLAVDRHGVLAAERSAMAASWLGPYRSGQTLWQAVGGVDAKAAEWIALAWDNLSAGGLPIEVAVDQFPRRLTIGERTVRLEIKPVVQSGSLRNALVVLSDITAELERERSEAISRDLVNLLERVAHDRAAISEFLADADRQIQSVEAGLAAMELRVDLADSQGAAGVASFRIDLHTLKGNAATFGLVHVARCCHALEDQLSPDGTGSWREAGGALLSCWRILRGGAWHILGSGRRNVVEIDAPALADLESRLSAAAASPEILDLVRSWWLEPVLLRLERAAAQARQIAQRLGHGDIMVDIDASGVRLDRERWLPFWKVFGHVIRNAVDHGLEPAADRLAAGKPLAGRIQLRARKQAGLVVIEVEDDGRGIAWDKVRERARACGLPADGAADLVSALFAEGLTTAETATELSGRGVGLAAVHAVCRQLGGGVSVSSSVGRGTLVRFSWPSGDAAGQEPVGGAAHHPIVLRTTANS